MNKLKVFFVLSLSLFMVMNNEAFAQKKKKTSKAPSKKTTTTSSATPSVAPPPPDFTEVPAPNLDSAGYNTLSVRPIHKSDIMYRMNIWRKLDLSEKCNTPWFSENSQLSKFIVEAVNRGELIPYADDSLVKQMSIPAFSEKVLDRSAMADAIDKTVKIPLKTKNLFLFEMREDLIFDKQRSRSYYDIQALTLILPAKFSGDKGAELSIATFKYKDLVKLLDKDPKAKWYNISNKAEDKRMSDAFDLRLFCSRIVKMANPSNKYIDEDVAYNNNIKSILITSQRLEHEIVAKENDLWDY